MQLLISRFYETTRKTTPTVHRAVSSKPVDRFQKSRIMKLLLQGSVDRLRGGKSPKESEIKVTPNNPLIPLISQESTCDWD